MAKKNRASLSSSDVAKKEHVEVIWISQCLLITL